jgi:hypothetical protein
MKSFYCAKVPRRVTDDECGTLEPCPADRNECEIYQKYVTIWEQKLAEAPKPDVPAEKKPAGKPAKKTAKTRVERKEKTCRRCGQTKPITEFYKKAESSDSHDYYCKECKKNFSKTHKKQKKQAQKSAEKPAQAPAPDNQDFSLLDAKTKNQNAQADLTEARRNALEESLNGQGSGLQEKTASGDNDNGNGRLVVDFSPYPDLHKRLVRAAIADFRPVDMEILALVRHALYRIDEKQIFS